MSAPQSLEPMPRAYEPGEVEERVYAFWKDGGFFTPVIDRAKQPFTVIMPPPNVTGELHMGHALTIAVEDMMVRWHRMLGDPTLYLPGTDHAGIATQVVVERDLASEGLTRHDLGREKFIERVWEWVKDYGDRIYRQTERLGVSCDWTRQAFTLDEGPARAVRTTFVNLYKKGLIYKGSRITNWCIRCRTALSDLEVKHQDEKAGLYRIRYPLASGGSLTIATTRPETLLGDTAVAVNPNDDRHAALIGETAILPIVGRELPIIGDEEVELGFGTGALKVTPGHDATDFEIGARHNLETVSVLNLDGTLNENAAEYAGMSVPDARAAVLERLESDGLLDGTDDLSHSVGHCDRCDQTVEPIVTDQWYISMKPLAKPAIDAVVDGRIRMVPDRFTRVYLNWMENIRDWPISRQLWWGHRIPVWYCPGGKMIVELEDPTSCPDCGSADLTRDPDVLDTWFSSGLWAHSTLGWPDEDSEDLAYFYPTSVMETGHDILFFWVARMIFFGIESMGEIPFRTVYLHGLVRDPAGVKMSKTRGNVVDPVELIEMYGADALRFALTTGTSAGNDMRMNEGKLEASRNFANKLWNASRFVIGNLQDAPASALASESAPRTREDRWILSRLNRVAERVDSRMRDYQLGEAQRAAHDFLWNEYCDWYIEMCKIRLRAANAQDGGNADGNAADSAPSPLPTLARVLETALRLLHPFLPFVTEEVWGRLAAAAPGVADGNAAGGNGKRPAALMVAPYPAADDSLTDADAEREIEAVIELVRAARNLRAEFRIPNNRILPARAAISDGCADAMRDALPFIRAQAKIDLALTPAAAANAAASADEIAQALSVGLLTLSLGEDVDVAAETERLQSELAELRKYETRLSRNLANENFVNRAPEDVVERERGRLSTAQSRIAALADMLARLGG